MLVMFLRDPQDSLPAVPQDIINIKDTVLLLRILHKPLTGSAERSI